MRTLKLALAAVAAFAFNANAQNAAVTGMGNGGSVKPPGGFYQGVVVANSGAVDGIGFHAGGVAACDGCHVMHNASGGVAKSTAQASSTAPWSNVTNMYLLQGSDQSSTCLICHSGQKAAGAQFTIADVTTTDAPTNRTPGGDFGWVKLSFGTGSPGARHGHNVVAADFPGMTADTGSMLTAPGGTWTGGPGKAAFACSSCHDPHGRYRVQNNGGLPNGYGFAGPFPGSLPSLPIAASGSYGTEPTGEFAVGSYRLLAGQRYAPASNSAFPFPNDPPFAVAPATYNNTEDTSANEVIVAYGTGMSEWCQNCHTNIHLDGYTSGVGALRHPAGSDAKLHTSQINVYNTYVSSGVVGAAGTSRYTSLVPFELGKDKKLGDLAKFANKTESIFATESSTVMCLSCHRAHASAFDNMVRWDQNATFLTDGGNFTTGATGGARSTTVTKAGYYDRSVGVGGTSIGAYQRSLCNKCHGKD